MAGIAKLQRNYVAALKAEHDKRGDEIERLRKRLADCVAWMDTREKQQPGMPRICDMARRVLIGKTDG